MRGTLRDGPRRRAEQYMAAKLWVWIVLAVGVLWSGTARAQVSMTPDPIDVGNVAVNGMATNTGALSSATNGVNVDITLMTGTCTGGGGTFTLSTPQGLTNVNLNSSVTVTVKYQPTARGTQTCTVNVYTTGMTTMPLVQFTVKGTGVAPVIGTVPAATYAYPAVRYNDAATTHTAALTLTVSNSGDAGQSLVVNSITFSTGQATDYSVTSGTLPATIAPGGSAPFTITFDPAAAGASATSMIINSTDPITPNKTITLSGTGATGVIAVTDIAFPTVTQGSSSTQNITITNAGLGTRGPLVVSSALFMNNTAGWFKFNIAGCAGTTTPCTFVSPFSITTGSATLPIMCSPPANASGSQSAMVIFTSDTDDATDSVANVSCTAGRADLTVDQTPLAFGNQLLNTTSTGQNVLIGNAGNQALTYSLSLVGTDATQFQITGIAGCTTNCSLAAGATGNVGVAFRPTTVGMKSASLRVTASNDPDTTFLDVPLAGTGVAPDSVLSATSLAFGSIDVGDTATAQTVMVTNNGTYPLTINAAFLATGAADYLTTGTTGTSVSITVQPSQSTSWTVACKPSVLGSRPGTFRITSNTGGVPNTNQDIPLTCTGLQGILAIVTPPANPYDFGGVREGDTVSQTWQLKNNGNTPVTNITVAFTGTGTGYMVTPTSVASLAAGASTTVTATFHPLDGTYGGIYIATYSGGWGNAKTTMTALSLNGDGLTTGYDLSPSAPNALDFGDVRFDQFKLMYVSIINNAGTALQIRGASITPGTAQTGEFTIQRCLKNNLAITCPTMAAPYNSSGVNDTIVLEIRFDPNNRVAMMDATLTVTSDLPGGNPDRTLTLKGNSITAGLALNPASMVLDFGPTDLDKVPVSVTRTITLTNTGAAPLDITSVTKIGGPLGNVRFTFGATTAPATVAPNGTYNIDVTYTPTIEKASNQPDTGSIVFGGVNGVFGGMASITIQLSGYGVDRHIALAPVPAFPDTFKNPDPPPTRPVTITNNGDATLNVSAVMVTNDPIWTIVNPDPVAVPGRGSYDFNVAFAPDTIGKAPTGHMTIMNNDNGMPLVAVDLNGNAVDRNVAVGPGTIDLGYVGIGMSVRLSELAPSEVLTVANAETGTDFPIKKIDIVGGNGAFAVETLDGNALPQPDTGIVLRASSSAQFDVVFTPNAEGDFSADAVVYLGSDPQHLDPRPAVRLVGRGLYVNTGGGGGCSTGRGNGIAMILVVVALMLGRRRRGVLVALVCVGGVARADQSRDVSLALFDPTPAATIGSTFQLQSPEVAEKGSLGFFSLVSYANKPLVLATTQNDDAAVENRTTLALGGAYAFGAFELGLRMPLYVQSGAALPTGQQRLEMFGVEPGGTARGDVTASGKYQIGARDNVSYGLAGALTLPTASKDQFAGNSLPTGRVVFLLALVKGPLTATLNAGGVVRAKAQLGSATQGSGGVFGVGLSWRAADKLWLAGEIYGELIPGGQSGQPATGQPMGAAELGKPIEGLLGLRYQMARTTNLGLAVGRGVTADLGAPALRGVLTLTYAPSASELKPLHPPRPPEPMKDADGDGIADKADGCPNEPEDKDLFDDADGCPDPDNDGDGIPDATDKCPLDAEDKDHFKDDDGCPEKDNDNDGIPDSSDKCPQVAEDKDGFEDTDGCPDPDNDGDGILDKVDKCPAEPETINGNNDDDGCPDKGNALIVLSPDRLELLESVQFNGSKITKASNNVLGQIGATLRAHPEIVRVRLTAHVQPTSNPAADKTLSESRAKAARDWLVDWGIDPLRLQAAGFGGTKPLVDPQSRGAAGINDRFEVIILERK